MSSYRGGKLAIPMTVSTAVHVARFSTHALRAAALQECKGVLEKEDSEGKGFGRHGGETGKLSGM